jgi:enhancing lycopene biosynthesis protein 2
MQKVAVILSGCGYLDGAEIREAVLSLLALDKHSVEVTCLAPDMDQHHVVNHLTGEEASEKRNTLVEAARIARGKVSDVAKADAADFDALIIPGGFGVAKNLCNFAFNGSGGEVIAPISKFVKDMHQDKKPIGAICIAPAMMGLLFGNEGVEVTIGNDEGTAAEIEKTGAKHITKAVNEIHVDSDRKIVTTPAYMFDDGKLTEIFQGIQACVDRTLEMI